MVRRAVVALSLVLRHGLRAVFLAREAKRRGAVQKKGELRPLISLLRRRKPRVVLEIGTYKGGTLWLWCRIAARDALIISVDLPGGQFGGGYEESQMRSLRSFSKRRQKLVLIRKDSHDPATRDELLAALSGRAIDFLFIDGDHTHEGVKLDFEMYSPLVSHNGVIAFHDVLPHTLETSGEVHVFWDELKSLGYNMTEFVDIDPSSDLEQWGGIGLIFGPLQHRPLPSRADVQDGPALKRLSQPAGSYEPREVRKRRRIDTRRID